MDTQTAITNYLNGLSDAELLRLSPLPYVPPGMDGPSFRARLLVDCDGTAKTVAEVMDPWQRQDYESLDPGWDSVAGLSDEPALLRAYLERPRGHSKTTDIAVMVLRVLWSSKRLLWGYAAAGDSDQAGLMRDAIEKILRLNPWLAEKIQLQRSKVINRETGAWLEIISSDAPSSYGQNPDFIIIDELTHWKKKDLWVSLLSSAAKRAKCMVCVISNAGQAKGRSWQWEVRENCRNAKDWYFSRLDGPQASWITPDRLEAQKRDLKVMPLEFRRLWLNEWTVEGMSGLDAMDVTAAFTLAGPDEGRIDGTWPYFAALDIGIKHDHSALIVIGLDLARRRIRLCHCRSWAPEDYVDGKIKLEDVYQECFDAHRRFGLSLLVFDVSQCHYIAQKLIVETRNEGNELEVVEWNSAAPRARDVQARALVQIFRNRMIDLYPAPRLEEDLLRIQIEEKLSGHKVTAISDDRGHADRAIALSFIADLAVRHLDGLAAAQNEEEELVIGSVL